MNIYQIHPSSAYYDTITDFIVNKFTDISQGKIILPTRQDCEYLQQRLISYSKTDAIILPKITTINSLIAEGEFSADLPKEVFTESLCLNVKLINIMMEILNELQTDKAIGYKISTASQLLEIINELKAQKIEPSALLNLDCFDKAEHNINSLHLLSNVYQVWEERLVALNINDRNSIMCKVRDILLKSLTTHNQYLLIAGTAGESVTELSFLRKALANTNTYYFPPPFDRNCINSNKQLTKLWQFLGINADKISHFPASISKKTLNYNSWFTAEREAVPADNIVIAEFSDIETEAKYIADLAEKNNSLLLLVPNYDSARKYKTEFIKRGINFTDKVPAKLSFSNQYSLLKLVVEDLSLTTEFNLTSFITLCKHPYVWDASLAELEQILCTQKKIITLEYVIELLTQRNCHKLLEYLAHKHVLHAITSFSLLAKEYIKITEVLTDKLWQGAAGAKLAEVIRSLALIEFIPSWLTIKEYSHLFLLSFQNITYLEEECISQIVIAPVETGYLLDADIVCLANCNADVFPIQYRHDPWLGNKLRSLLSLTNNTTHIEKYNYILYLLLHKTNLYITRPTDNCGEILLESLLLSNLKAIIPASNILTYHDVQRSITPHNAPPTTDNSIYLPGKLSATAVERLIKDPYHFWLQHIHKIQQFDDIYADDSVKDFGITIHKIIELHSSQKWTNGEECTNMWHIISESLISKIRSPLRVALWRPKIEKIGQLFLSFEQIRKNERKYLRSEIAGNMELLLHNGTKSITITSIADRIEIDYAGNITLIDFKTGAIPAKEDVLNGHSVQMIIEAIIYFSGGFADIPIKNEVTCIYVKLSSQLDEPEYLSFSLTREDIIKHKAGLIQLLEYYDGADINTYLASVTKTI